MIGTIKTIIVFDSDKIDKSQRMTLKNCNLSKEYKDYQHLIIYVDEEGNSTYLRNKWGKKGLIEYQHHEASERINRIMPEPKFHCRISEARFYNAI